MNSGLAITANRNTSSGTRAVSLRQPEPQKYSNEPIKRARRWLGKVERKALGKGGGKQSVLSSLMLNKKTNGQFAFSAEQIESNKQQRLMLASAPDH